MEGQRRAADRRQHSSSAAADRRPILGSGAAGDGATSSQNCQQVQREAKAKQTGKATTTHSKFNRILGNLERSILNQFNNNSEKSPNGFDQKRKGMPTSAKRKQIIHLSQQQQQQQQQPQAATTSDAANRKRNPIASGGLSDGDPAARRPHLATGRDRITQALKVPVSKAGKLTLNAKCQVQESPGQQSAALCSNLATNKLSIPPPHANGDARSLNQTLLFGSGALQTRLEPAEKHQQATPETTATLIANSSSATINSVANQGGGYHPGAHQLRNEPRLLAELQDRNANRLNSSPAASAKSLPATGPKPGSHLKTTSKEDEEESGFATYQSRRALLQHFQQKQQQLGSPGEPAATSKENMLPNRMNYPLSSPQASHLMIQQHQGTRTMQSTGGALFHHQYNPAMIPPSNQVPIMPPRDQGNLRYVTYNNSNNQRVPPIHMFHRGQDQVPTASQVNQANLIDNQQQQMQFQRINEQQHSTDNGQQIYANAPPKPRRYQYYEGPQAANHHQAMNVNEIMTHNRGQTMNTHQMNTMAHLMQRQATLPQQPNPNQQLVFNHQGQLCQPHPMMIHSGPSQGNLSYLGLSNSRVGPQFNYDKWTGPRQQVHNQQQANIFQQQQPPMNFSMMKSKSSLDAGDLARFKQNRQLQNQPQPLYGYRQDEPTTSQQQQQAINLSQQSRQSQIHSQRFLPQDIGNPMSGNLQRSKSVTHLLPEPERDNILGNGQAHLGYQDQAQAAGHKYLSTLSSASTNQLNNVGTIQIQPPMTHRNNEINALHHLSHEVRPQTVTRQQTQQHQVLGAIDTGPWPERAQQRGGLLYNTSNDIIAGHNLSQRTKSMAALSGGDLTFSNKTIRHSPRNSNVSQEALGVRKPSLDDQIKHLLIGGADNPIVSRASRTDAVTSANYRDDNAIYQTFARNNGSLGLVPCSSAATLVSPRAPMSVAGPATWATAANAQNNQSTINQTHSIGSTDNALHHYHEKGITKPDCFDANPSVGANRSSRAPISTGDFSLAELNVVDMGNRQQRQYNLDQAGPAESQKNNPQQLVRRQNDANSHLIVDLTTPRVLAKTKTTLLPASRQTTSDNWSINQVGLPQMSSESTAAPTSQTTVHHVKPPTAISTTSCSSERQAEILDPASKNRSELAVANDPILERSAPYYYSDLKSKEQREALRSIVQQKSLSPPPQLLSRSTDQSSTRLALRSATLHPGHARTLSDNLAQQRHQNRNDLGAALRNQSHLVDSNSTSNIAKNIDKLFECSFESQNSMTNATAQSMLTLAGNNKQPKDTNIGSVSSGYCSSELPSKNISKSKSLDNISQKSFQDGKGSTNPVYENIRCSNKLLNAINNSTVGFSTSGTSSNMKSLANANTNSDESMDSILSSSFNDSDSCSDIIDEIKISSTDNHLNDISDLIEQLKISQSKMAEEYKSTLVRIAKTINSKTRQDEKKNSDKLAKRLQLLESKSKKCESRSKNQLALIQMMEKVLRQSRLRAISNRSSAASQQQVMSDETSSASTSSSKQPSHDGLSSLEGQVDSKREQASCLDKVSDKFRSTSADYANSNGTMKRAPPCEKSANGVNKLKTRSPQEIIKAIVVEKDTSPREIVKSKTTMNIVSAPEEKRDESSPVNDAQGDIARKSKINAVAKRILDIESRNNNLREKNLDAQRKTNALRSSPSVDSDPSPELRKDQPKQRGDNGSSGGDDEEENEASLRVDEDFIEFLSTDSASHRSPFGASQFSASEFNASTSASDSSTSCSAVNDSLNSTIPARKSSPQGGKDRASATGSPLVTIGILKNHHRTSNYDESESTSNGHTNNRNSPTVIRNGNDKGPAREGSNEKFKNVLGNVVDVDNSPQGCSPVNNQPQTPCLN